MKQAVGAGFGHLFEKFWLIRGENDTLGFNCFAVCIAGAATIFYIEQITKVSEVFWRDRFPVFLTLNAAFCASIAQGFPFVSG